MRRIAKTCLLLCLCLQACKPEEVPQPSYCLPCMEPPPGYGSGNWTGHANASLNSGIRFQYDWVLPSYLSVAPHPNLSTQFALLRPGDNTSSLYVRDEITHQGGMMPGCFPRNSYMDWGSNGWIIFTDPSRQIYKVNPLDSTVLQLTWDSKPHAYPMWNPDGTQFACLRFDAATPNLLSMPCQLLIADENATEIRHFDSIVGPPRWSRDGQRIVTSDATIMTQLFWIDPLGNGERHVFYHAPVGQHITWYDWLPDGEHLVVLLEDHDQNQLLGRVNVNTGLFTQWHSGCRSDKFSYPICSRSDDWIYVQRYAYDCDDETRVATFYNQIWKMDANGESLQVVSW